MYCDVEGSLWRDANDVHHGLIDLEGVLVADGLQGLNHDDHLLRSSSCRPRSAIVRWLAEGRRGDARIGLMKHMYGWNSQ